MVPHPGDISSESGEEREGGTGALLTLEQEGGTGALLTHEQEGGAALLTLDEPPQDKQKELATEASAAAENLLQL